MTDNVMAILDRIDADMALLRRIISTQSPSKSTSGKDVVPVLKSSYTKAAAELEKARIEGAFRAGRISYDKKRGMKMMVTKATEGWTPVGE